MWYRRIEMEELKGKTFVDIQINDDNGEKNKIIFTDDEGYVYKMYHDQDCCEWVYIEDICGDINNLIGVPIVMAEEITNRDDAPLDDADYSYTWTFYKFATSKGYVTIRWYGTSNGYYSEDACIELIKMPMLKFKKEDRITNISNINEYEKSFIDTGIYLRSYIMDDVNFNTLYKSKYNIINKDKYIGNIVEFNDEYVCVDVNIEMADAIPYPEKCVAKYNFIYNDDDTVSSISQIYIEEE